MEHNHDFSFGAQFIAHGGLSLDFNYAHDDVFSQTDLCYVFTPTATAPLPAGATNAGTCVPTADNPTATSNLYLGNGYYHAPSNFYSAAVNFAPIKYFDFNGGTRVNTLNGQRRRAESAHGSRRAAIKDTDAVCRSRGARRSSMDMAWQLESSRLR